MFRIIQSSIEYCVSGPLLAVLLSFAAASAHAQQVGTPGPYQVMVKAAANYAAPKIDTVIECKPAATAGHFAGPLPAVMLIHGGAWHSGTNQIDAAGLSGRWCTLWASWGFDAFSVGYRLIWQKSWPAQIVDVQASIRWVRVHAAQLNVNPRMIVVNGDSAGGQLAMIAGYNRTILPGDLAADNAEINPQPQLVISQFGPWTFGPPRPSAAPSVRAEDYAQQMILDHADGRITATTPNTLFVQGTKDTRVNPCTQSEPAYRFLRANNRPASYMAYSGDHEFGRMTLSPWDTVVGDIQLRTIAFAYKRAHLLGVLPTSEPGPGGNFADANLPLGCP